MKFEERLNELINEVEVPDELLPQNIAKMLKAEKAQSKQEAARYKDTRTASSVHAQRRTIIMRTVAATAACAAFAAGMLVYNSRREDQIAIDDRPHYEAVPPVNPDSYDDLYNIYTDIYLNEGSNKSGGYGNDTAIGEENSSSEQPIEYSGTQPQDIPPDIFAYDFTDYGLNVSEADIVKCDGDYMYCLKDNTLYIVSLETMEVISTIESTLNPPVEIYIEGDRVILISKETEEIQVISSGTDKAAADSSEAGHLPTASDVPANDADTVQPAEYSSGFTDEQLLNDKTGLDMQAEDNGFLRGGIGRMNTVVDIYDMQDPAFPVHTTSYKQNGSYTASRLVDGQLYIVTAYSDYRIKPLDTQADLDGFVPAYYINGEKFFLAAGDINVPAGANSTDYTVISAINVSGDFSAAVKAVLGSSGNVYCSADTLYTVGVGKRDTEYSIISAFDLSGSGIKYRTSGSVAGIFLSQHSMNEYDGNFRIAAKTTDEEGISSVALYVLDRDLTVVNSAGKLLPSRNVTSVRFEGNYARLFEDGGKTSSAVIDLSSFPPSMTQSPIVSSAYLYSYPGNRLLGVGKAQEGEGMTLTMYDSESGIMLGSATFADKEREIFSRAFTDRRAVLVDTESGIIGIPLYSHNEFGTKNSYYVYSYDDSVGFISKGVIEYVDIDDSLAFERGEVSGENLYVIGSGRIISARASDLKIIGVYEY